jgi:hypothetical protein
MFFSMFLNVSSEVSRLNPAAGITMSLSNLILLFLII